MDKENQHNQANPADQKAARLITQLVAPHCLLPLSHNVSHTTTAMELEPKDVLQPSWIPIYKRQISVLHNQLARVRSTLFVLKHVAKFPFDLFGEHYDPFWNLVRRSLETTVVIGLWRLILDTSRDSLTVRKLKSAVMTHVVDDAAKRRIAECLRVSNADTRISQIENKITELRHKHFAHLDRDSATGKGGPATSSAVSFEELSELATAAHDLINAIGMGTHYKTLYPDYDPSVTCGGQRITPDVEAMFDEMVNRCDDIRMPEEKPYEFRLYWKQRTPRQRETYNAYRKKFGLPEVPNDD